MADEITVDSVLRAEKDDLSLQFRKNGVRIDLTGKNFVHRIQVIGTSLEALDIGDVGTPGMAVFFNHGPGSVQIGARTPGSGPVFVALAKPLSGEPAGPMRLATNAPYAIASTGGTQIEYVIIEE